MTGIDIQATAIAEGAATVADAEYAALHEGCGLLERSERGELALSGSGALEFLNGQVTNDVEGLRAGEGRYAAFLTHKGKMLGDVRILAAGQAPAGLVPGVPGVEEGAPPRLLLDTERVCLQALFDMIRRFKVGFDVELHKRTLQTGLLSLIGPLAASPLRGCPGLQDIGDEEHANAAIELDGIGALAVRTDIGLDLFCDAPQTEALTAALLARGALAVSLAAAECVRVECGRPRYGIDLDDSVIPQEAALNERAVSFTKGCYVGQETVARLYYKGKPNRHLRGLRLSAPAAAGEQLRAGERVVGRLGSVALSPRLGPIALALVRREAEPGSALDVGEDGVSARVLELPFPV